VTYNFSSGPAMLPSEVMREAYQEFLNYSESGMSVMELNHRSLLFNEIVDEAKSDLTELLSIPDNYEILFLQGGASLQFAAVPMNIMRNQKAGFIMTGHWSKRAFEEAQMYGQAIELASSADKNYSYIPDCSNLAIQDDLDYVHICENNTIYGTRFIQLPNTMGKDIVSDMSSCILSEPIDVSKYGVIFAGAQKNMGPAGVTIVIIREDLIRDDVMAGTPSVMKYKNQLDNNSRFNTPPCYSIYMCGKVFKWLKRMGGLSAMKEINRKKAELVYNYLDESKLFHGTVDREFRSIANVTFTTGNSDLDMLFVEDSKKAGFVGLKGHRFVGGLRVSLYNAIPIENVKALVNYMKQYEVSCTSSMQL